MGLLKMFISLLILSACSSEGRGRYGVSLSKCCGMYQRLDVSNRRCVDTKWSQNATINWGKYGDIKAPFDQQWLHRWFPPGLPLKHLENINYRRETHRTQSVILQVNSSIFWDERSYEALRLPGAVALYFISIVRERVERGKVNLFTSFCFDATSEESENYALVFSTHQSHPKVTQKCCMEGFLLAVKRGSLLECKQDYRGWWSPFNSSMGSHIHPETPYYSFTPSMSKQIYEWKPRPSPEVFVKHLLKKEIETFFSISDTCADFKLEEDGSISEVLGYSYTSRYTRSMYWLTRNLPFASISLLVAALAAIVLKKQMRKKAHGWCLACHAFCLLLFNVGQVGYYLGISEEVDPVPFYVPERLVSTCLGFSFTLYFFLTAAASWLSAVCLNMTFGFRARGRLARDGGSDKKRFLWLSLFAWGIPVLLTAISVSVFLTQSTTMRQVTYVQGKRRTQVSYQGSWYRPSFVETRTCFDELVPCFTKGRRRTMLQCELSIAKGGSLLYYYGPICALVLVNVVALSLTARRVHELRRGNSILRRDDKEGGGKGEGAEGEKKKQKKEKGGKGAAGKKGKGGGSDTQSMTVYIKLLLTAGLLEIVTELGAWATSTVDSDPEQRDYNHVIDHTLAYRAAGYCTDLFRAACVLWLAAPEITDVGALWQRFRSKKGAP